MRPKKAAGNKVKTSIVGLYKEDLVIVQELTNKYGVGLSGLVRMLLREKYASNAKDSK